MEEQEVADIVETGVYERLSLEELEKRLEMESTGVEAELPY
jgi:hypothetical protein